MEPLQRFLLLACSQAPASSGAPAPVSGMVTVAAAPGAPAAAATGKPSWEDEDTAVPPEKFTESARNFEEAKKALLEGYYDTGVTEDDLYRAAVAGMLQRVDPKMRKWNKLLSPSEIAELRNDLQGEIVGVGIGIEIDPATGRGWHPRTRSSR